MVKKKGGDSQRVSEEQLVQKFPYRCPYCDKVISYEKVNLKVGENEIKCPSCKEVYIKVVLDKGETKD